MATSNSRTDSAASKPAKRARKARPAMNRGLAKLARLNFEPLLTENTVQEYEANFQENFGVVRRAALWSLTRSHQQLLEGFGKTEDDKWLYEFVQGLRDYRDHLRVLVKLTEIAEARSLCCAAAAYEQEVSHA